LDSSDPLSIRQLEVFVTLIEQTSFTNAARKLGLSQSTVSGHVADLEKRLGVLLVERHRGGVQPTAAGSALLRPAREVLRAEESARLAVRELSGLVQGRLVVGASTIPASYLVPEMLARFHAEHPAIALQVATGDSGEILARLRAADLEVGVIGREPDGDDLDSVPVGEDRLILVAAPEHPLGSGRAVSLADLRRHPLVVREEGSGTRASAEQALHDLGAAGGEEEPEPFPSVCEMGSTESQRAALCAGLGPGFISDLAAAAELAAGKLVEVPLRRFRVTRSFHLVARRDVVLSPAARAFVALTRPR
jgi:DNA-binding transcriptional LysR family regulator